MQSSSHAAKVRSPTNAPFIQDKGSIKKASAQWKPLRRSYGKEKRGTYCLMKRAVWVLRLGPSTRTIYTPTGSVRTESVAGAESLNS